MAEAIGWMSIVNRLEKRIDCIMDISDEIELESIMHFADDFLQDQRIHFIYNSGLPIALRGKIRGICHECDLKGDSEMKEVARSFRELTDYGRP